LKVREIVPTVEHTVAFELYALGRISDGSGCYCLANAGGDIIYIGQAVELRRRLIEHFESDKRTAWTEYGRISVVWWRGEETIRLDALERGWINAAVLRDGRLPPLNRVTGHL
jgi:hypothetical protein